MGGRRGTEGKVKQSLGCYCLCEVWRGHKKHMLECGDCASAQTLPLHIQHPWASPPEPPNTSPQPLAVTPRSDTTGPCCGKAGASGLQPLYPAIACPGSLSAGDKMPAVCGPYLPGPSCPMPAAQRQGSCPDMAERSSPSNHACRGERQPRPLSQPRLSHLPLRHLGPQWFFSFLPWAHEPQPGA